MLALGAIALAAGAAAARVELLFLGGVLVAAVAIGWIALWFVPAPRAVRRELSQEVAPVGAPVQIRARVAPSLVDPASIDDIVPDALEPIDVDASEGSSHLSYAVVAVRRGAHVIGPLSLTFVAPFGVARRRRLGRRADVLLATPPIVPLQPMAGGNGDGPAPQSRDRRGHGSDDLIPRPYAPGDSMRRVHWRASAHHGDLMVREEEREDRRSARLTLALDGFEADAFEHALSAAASIVRLLLDGGSVVDVRGAGGGRVALVEDEADFVDLLARWARLEPGEAPGEEAAAAARIEAPSATVEIRGSGSPAPAAGPGSHVALVGDGDREWVRRARLDGWRAAALGEDIAGSWDAALEGGGDG